MNKIHVTYTGLMSINIAAAVLCGAVGITSPHIAVMIGEAVLTLVNIWLIMFNFRQMNMVLKRSGYKPVTFEMFTSSPTIMAFVKKYLYK